MNDQEAQWDKKKETLMADVFFLYYMSFSWADRLQWVHFIQTLHKTTMGGISEMKARGLLASWIGCEDKEAQDDKKKDDPYGRCVFFILYMFCF